MKFRFFLWSVFLVALTASGSGAESACSVISLSAQKGKVSLRGAGTIVHFENPAHLRVFTLAHVVEGADSIQAQCGDAKADLRIQAIDAGRDFALLEFSAAALPSFAKPLFHFPPKDGEISRSRFTHPFPDWTQDEILFKTLTPTSLAEFPAMTGYPRLPDDYLADISMHPAWKSLLGELRWLESRSAAWPQYGSIIHTFGAAGAHGTSGTPLIAQSATKAMHTAGIAGFMAKTERNGIRSLAIPVKEVLNWLSSPTSQSSVKVRSEIISHQRRDYWERVRELHFARGKKSFTFRELCPSSYWSPIVGGGGGSWGDSGGSGNPLKNLKYSGLSLDGTLAATKDLSACSQEGLRWNDKTVIGFMGTRKFHVIRSIEDIRAALRDFPADKDIIPALVTTENFATMGGYGLLCRNADQFDGTQADFSKAWLQVAPTTKQSFAVSHYQLQRNRGIKRAWDHPHFRCARDRGKSDALIFQLDDRNAPFLRIHTLRIPNGGGSSHPETQNQILYAKLEFSGEKISGTLRIANRILEINQTRTGFWSHRIPTPQGEVLVLLDTKDKIFSVTHDPRGEPNLTSLTGTPAIFAAEWDQLWFLSFAFYARSPMSSTTAEELVKKMGKVKP